MDALVNDARFAATMFLVVDFEGLTPAGRPAEPIEVAALALRPVGDRLVEVGRFEELMRPPADVPVTARDVQLKGITQQMLSTARPAAEVLARLDARLTAPPYRLVAHHASTEAGIIGRRAEHCPVLAATPLLDTLRLAKAVVPGLGSYGLDELLGYYGIPQDSQTASRDARCRGHHPGAGPAAERRMRQRTLEHPPRTGRGRRVTAQPAAGA